MSLYIENINGDVDRPTDRPTDRVNIVILFLTYLEETEIPSTYSLATHIPSTEVAHKEKANGGEEELRESDQDEDGVSAAQVEPVAAEQTKEDAAIISIFSKIKISLNLIAVAVS